MHTLKDIAKASELIATKGATAYLEASKLVGDDIASAILIHDFLKSSRLLGVESALDSIDSVLPTHVAASIKQGQFRFYLTASHVLDSMSACVVRFRDELWPTEEHAYQAAKFAERSIIDLIKAASTPYEAKSLARDCKRYRSDNWHDVRVDIAREIVFAKARQHKVVRDVLEETGQSVIIEDSPHDSFWGRGPNYDGQNHKGRLWMEARNLLRQGLL
jgi:ribA/ribD-fused uncharacterized protein